MSIFRPNRPRYSPSGVTDFWGWWNGGGSTGISDALSGRDLRHVDRELSKRIAAISPDLDWETAPGTASQHQLRVSGGGIPEFRPYAFRWEHGAPPPDITWEYVAGRSKFPIGSLQSVDILGRRIDPNLARFVLRSTPFPSRVKVDCFHPAFLELKRPAAMHVSALFLDWIVGEEDVARYVSGFEVWRETPAKAVDVSGLLAAIDEIRIAPGKDKFGQIQGEVDGQPLVATVLSSARWIDNPAFDTHVQLEMRFTAARGPFPSEAEVDRIQSLDESISAGIGSRALRVAREYHGGVCTLHFYADSQDPIAIDFFTAWVAGHPGWKMSRSPDPSWERVAYLLG